MPIGKIGKPNIRKGLKTGFRPMAGLNTSGDRRRIPHDVTSNAARTGSNLKLRVAHVKSRPKKMY